MNPKTRTTTPHYEPTAVDVFLMSMVNLWASTGGDVEALVGEMEAIAAAYREEQRVTVQ